MYSQESEAEIKREVSQLAQEKEDLVLQVKSLQASLAEVESKQSVTNNGERYNVLCPLMILGSQFQYNPEFTLLNIVIILFNILT